MTDQRPSPLLLVRSVALLAAVALLVTACVNGGSEDEAGGDRPIGAVADPAGLASIEEGACGFDEAVPLPVRPTCYSVSVPENWADPDPDDQVLIPVAVFQGDGSLNDPIIYFDGGPGGNTLDSLAFTFAQLVGPFLDGRDYIVFDQRGVGVSEPALECPEVDEVMLADLAGEIDSVELADAALAAHEECRDRLQASGVDLSAYNSVASANDVEAIRSLLGYEQLNVIGVSYGTRLGQTYLRMYPGSTRSIVLDSIFPTEADLWSAFAPGARRAFEQLFQGCADDADCAAAHPDLEARFFALLDRLDAEPITVELTDQVAGTDFDAVVDGDDVMGLVFSALYNRSMFSLIPTMVAEAEAGDHDVIAFLGSVQYTNRSFFTVGQQLSVECNEEIPFESEDVLVANTPEDPGYARLQRIDGELTFFDICEVWPAGQAPEVEDETVVSDVPALLLAGQYDPITPPSGVDTVAQGLANASSALLPYEGHGIAGTPCGAEIVSGFIDDPSAAPDRSCIDSSPAPVWVPGIDDAPVELVEFTNEGLVAASGVRPESWIDVGNGVFARQRTAIDPTTLVVQPTSGLDPAALIGFLGGQLEIEFTEDEPLTVEGRVWTTFRGSGSDGSEARVAVSSGPDGILVVLVAEPEEIGPLSESVFVPALGAARAG